MQGAVHCVETTLGAVFELAGRKRLSLNLPYVNLPPALLRILSSRIDEVIGAAKCLTVLVRHRGRRCSCCSVESATLAVHIVCIAA